ncbi:MAG: EAL domain-containing protein [Rhodanobacter sp.]
MMVGVGTIELGYFDAGLLAAAAVALGVSLQFSVTSLRPPRNSMHLAFAILCLCLATLALANIALDNATTSAQAILAVRWMCAASVLSFPAMVWFVGDYTGSPVRGIALTAVSAVTLVFFVANLYSPSSLLYSEARLGGPTRLPWGEVLSSIEGTPSGWGITFHALTYGVFAWALHRGIQQWRHRNRTAGLLLCICLAAQLLALLWGDIVVDAMGHPYPYLDAFAFQSFVLLMGLSLATQLNSRTLQLERAMRELRSEAETRREAEVDLRHVAYHDALTGLPNRPRALYMLADMDADAVQSGMHGAVLMIDLDNFKTINDSLGHQVGDRVLEAIADALLAAAPTDATVARLGGDEFVMLLGALDSDPDAAAALAIDVARHLVARLALPLAIDSRMLNVGASIGVAVFPDAGKGPADVLRCADIALYAAKDAGRSRAELFLPQMQRAADARLELERGLATAVENAELSLRFQPLVSCDGALAGAEVLLRWQHPLLGAVMPATFIPIAEETGLIHGIGAWVIAQSCHRMREWQQRGVDFGGRLAVNVSPWQLANPQFVQQVEAQVRGAGVDPSALTLELTESALLDDFDAALDTLQQLSAVGFRLALDDFGTGYSSLAYLQRLPLDELKIDQSFIRLLQPSTVDPLAAFIIDVGRRLGMLTVAEGVETAEQKALLEALGCDLLQGYLISKPLTETEYLAWLAQRNTPASADKVVSR